jgi:xanthine dehydrogenase accessory factor
VRELLGDIERWRNDNSTFALARVVRTEGSAPRAPGAAMAVTAESQVAGSVSGGCVEGAVVTEALEVIASGVPRLVRFGYSDEVGFSVGLTCGGIIDIFVAPGLIDGYDELTEALRAQRPVVVATVISTSESEPPGPGERLRYQPDGELVAPGGARLGASMLVFDGDLCSGTLGNAGLDRSVRRDAAGALRQGRSALRHYGPAGEARSEEITVFLEAYAPPPRMVIFGAVDFTAALVRVAKTLGYAVTVCDARATFATPERFPAADEVVVEWPDRYLERVGSSLTARDALCVLTHDPKFDIPAILAALTTDVGYLGAMGSRRTHADRVRRLEEEGVEREGIERIHAPIGLDLGAATPEETAIAILAEIIAARNQRVPVPLAESEGPIHASFDLAGATGA